jgi:copper chaperone CopZ
MSESTYIVEGMSCGSCAGKVTDRVERIPGVADVDVDLATGGVTVTTDTPVSEETVKQAIEEAGYTLTSA